MNETITSKKLCGLIKGGMFDITSVTRRYFNRVGIAEAIKTEKFMEDLDTVTSAGIFDIVEWIYYMSSEGIVILTADLHDRYAGEYIEVLGKVAGGLTSKELKMELEARHIRRSEE
ncbi:hypothetical protein RJD28_11445 [Oscillospiraceae bacterium NTUH-002-81]|nr:hypothetical protein RJD28_11445 [Oscillospiraceae bacterium NTUH-002-81]